MVLELQPSGYHNITIKHDTGAIVLMLVRRLQTTKDEKTRWCTGKLHPFPWLSHLVLDCEIKAFLK